MKVLILTDNEVEALRRLVDQLIEDSQEWVLEREESVKSVLFWHALLEKLLVAENGNDVDPDTE